MQGTDYLGSDRFSALGGKPVLVVEAASWHRPASPIQAVVIGIDREGDLPTVSDQEFDVLLTTFKAAPKPWVSLDPTQFDDTVQRLTGSVDANPIAATIGAQVLRLSSGLTLSDAITVESFAYSALLGGGEFSNWMAASKHSKLSAVPTDPVVVHRETDKITLKLNDHENRNEMSATMRDALYEALANILDDPSKPDVTLEGAGKCFSTGGSLPEFGTARDLAEAHVARSLHSCAIALDALGERATVMLHGACVGSGIEIAAAAHHRIAAPAAWFQLPELSMGLIPGAGGTATVARAIGRHRTMWMLLSGKRISAAQALDWGLVHAIKGKP
ncbi:MAG: enoyl-CoA hydratase/isomerase family protein [Parasphingorhabdus sp.]|uniref:enoyl-CoA hydratase/isomerase family protein n=1 Tax=Parasphingorhabdus sp. TaxID=2709688 RepID=UPI0030027822